LQSVYQTLRACSQEASVPSVDQTPEKRGIHWPAIVRTLLLQVTILLLLSGAFVRYVSWSSDRAWAEFNAATAPLAPDAKPRLPPATPVQAVKAPCAHKGLKEAG
jgi:hypothetical protein